MTVVQSIVGEVKLQFPANVDKLSPTVVSLVLEGIAQNTSGSVFEAQVMLSSHHTTTFTALDYKGELR
jgi:hypothetical protein